MPSPRLIRVKPGELRLPPDRDSVDSIKLSRQITEFGASNRGMPPVQVTRGAKGELMINDGVTRATRAHLYRKRSITAEIIHESPDVDFGHLPKVKEQ